MNSLCLSDHLPCANVILRTIFLYLNLRESFGYIVFCLHFVQMHHLGIKTACVFSSVQSLSRVGFFAAPWTAACQASLSIMNSWSLLQLMSITTVMSSNNLILCCPLFLPSSIFPSIRVSSNESVLHTGWPQYWSFSFSISPSIEYSGLISFRIDWLDLLAVQGTLKRVFSNTSIQKHQFGAQISLVQLSHRYMTTGKTIALTKWTFVGKVMSLLCNVQSSLVIAFLPRIKHP